MSLSLSVPVNLKTKNIKQMDSLGSVIRAIPATPRIAEGSGTPLNDTPTKNVGIFHLSYLMLVFHSC